MSESVKDYPPYLDYPKPRKKRTNGGRVRAMNDEELAIWIVKRTEGWGMPECDLYVQSWLDWLRQEVSDNG